MVTGLPKSAIVVLDFSFFLDIFRMLFVLSSLSRKGMGSLLTEYRTSLAFRLLQLLAKGLCRESDEDGITMLQSLESFVG